MYDPVYPINIRINDLVIEYSGGNNSRFAELIGSNEANIRKYRKDTAPNIDIINDICQKFAIRHEWLLTGRGMREKVYTESESLCFIYNKLDQIEEIIREIRSLEKEDRVLEQAAEGQELYKLTTKYQRKAKKDKKP